MSRSVTLGRGGRSFIVAVLLLACFSFAATVSADERPSVTITTSEPYQRDNSAEAALTHTSGIQAAEWCREMTATFTHSGQYSVSSSTEWCWNNTIITFRDIDGPVFQRHGGRYFVWGLSTRPTGGGTGNWYAEDLTHWEAQKCEGNVGVRGRRPGVGIECDDVELHWLRKTQYFDGDYDYYHWET